MGTGEYNLRGSRGGASVADECAAGAFALKIVM